MLVPHQLEDRDRSEGLTMNIQVAAVYTHTHYNYNTALTAPVSSWLNQFPPGGSLPPRLV